MSKTNIPFFWSIQSISRKSMPWYGDIYNLISQNFRIIPKGTYNHYNWYLRSNSVIQIL